MTEDPKRSEPKSMSEFTRQAAQTQNGLLSEFWAFLRHNRKWWLAPIFIVLLLVGGLLILGGTSAAPFIYTLF